MSSKMVKIYAIYQLKKVIIPKFVDLIDEKLFKSGENIKEIILKGNSILKGNNWKILKIFNIYKWRYGKNKCKKFKRWNRN